MQRKEPFVETTFAVEVGDGILVDADTKVLFMTTDYYCITVRSKATLNALIKTLQEAETQYKDDPMTREQAEADAAKHFAENIGKPAFGSEFWYEDKYGSQSDLILPCPSHIGRVIGMECFTSSDNIMSVFWRIQVSVGDKLLLGYNGNFVNMWIRDYEITM